VKQKRSIGEITRYTDVLELNIKYYGVKMSQKQAKGGHSVEKRKKGGGFKLKLLGGGSSLLRSDGRTRESFGGKKGVVVLIWERTGEVE